MADEGKRIVRVTQTQVTFAKLRIAIDRRLGRQTPPEIVQIAEARRA